MKTAVLLLNFGEPAETTPEVVIPFLERIFATNVALTGAATPEEARARHRRMAEARAPGLIEEYERIGGSPLAAQAQAQADAVAAELTARGRGPVQAWVGMQFTDPSIADAVRSAREWGAERLVAVAVYPICGPSTTVAALADVDRAVAEAGWDVEVRGVSGWHRHPAYVRVRADAIRGVLARDGISLDDPRTKLVFSAHGTPMKYVQAGSRYVEYVEELVRAVSAELGGVEYVLGYQNHDNRPGVEWTQPDTESVVRSIDADRIVVEPMSFMHEQSETLAELDHGMRGVAEERGLGFHRVPVPHDAPAFISLLADLVDESIALRPCRCAPGAWCTNAPAAAAA